MTTEIYLALVEANKTIEGLRQEIIELNHRAQQIDALIGAEKACDAVKIDKLQKENAILKENIDRTKDTANSFLKNNKKVKQENAQLLFVLKNILEQDQLRGYPMGKEWKSIVELVKSTLIEIQGKEK